MLVPKIDLIPDLEGCVYKLFWGEVYVIVKCKTFVRSKTIFEQSLDRFLNRNGEDILYHRFFTYIKTHPFYSFRVNVVLRSNNPYRLLVKEQELLDESRSDLNCFNVSFDAYVPKGIQGKRKAWINRGHYLNFMTWKKKRSSKNAALHLSG
jgi:hypothetical protein